MGKRLLTVWGSGAMLGCGVGDPQWFWLGCTLSIGLIGLWALLAWNDRHIEELQTEREEIINAAELDEYRGLCDVRFL